jgi:hypothetical protein
MPGPGSPVANAFCACSFEPFLRPGSNFNSFQRERNIMAGFSLGDVSKTSTTQASLEADEKAVHNLILRPVPEMPYGRLSGTTSPPISQYALVAIYTVGCLALTTTTAFPAQDTASYQAYQQGLIKAKPNRVSDNPVGDTEISSQQVPEETANSLVEYKVTMNRKTSELSKLVMMDNTVGHVFPGALLWAAEVRDGRLHQLEQIPGRPPVTVTFAGMREIPSSLPVAAVVSTNKQATGEETRHVSFEHNGRFSDFEEKARPILKQNSAPSSRLVSDYVIRESLKDALLSIGLSAKYWEASMSAGLQNIRNEKRTVAIMTLDQVNFSATADAPPLGGYLPEQLLKTNETVASRLVSGMTSGGEPVYVRKVDYGRRVIVSLSADSSKEELNEALKVAVDAAAYSFKGNIVDKRKVAFNSVEGKLIIIGGKYPEGVNGFFGGDLSAFIKTIQAIMAKTNVDYDPKVGAVPVSFELAYVDDNAPMQVYETAEFSGKIPIRSFGKQVRTEKITTNFRDAMKFDGDEEIHTDDWTLVEISSQKLELSKDGRTVTFTLVWQASEAQKDRSIRKGATKIKSSKSFPVRFTKPVKILSQTSFGTRRQWYSGAAHALQSFDNCGLLRNIRVQFDDKTRDSVRAQRLEAELEFTVWMEE